ncbi:MAG: hypothetical protein V1793_07790, partial [Pseudomonadota bacterium]
AAALLLILNLWKKGRAQAKFWLFPLMNLWSNIHGGFIEAIVLVAILFLGQGSMVILGRFFGDRFAVCTSKQMVYAGAGMVIVLLVPIVFSPFGIENLLHPLLITLDKDAALWRRVAEWRSIFIQGHFGNAEPYKIFLYGFCCLILVHALAVFRHGPAGRAAGSAPKTAWAPILRYDIIQLGIIIFTIIISCTSSRFVFLASVVLSCYLAVMLQDLYAIYILPRLTGISTKTSLNIMGSLAAGIAVIAISSQIRITYETDYAGKNGSGKDSLFYNMVAFEQQFDDAMKFVTDNHISGLVFPDWRNGGYICFAQPPDPVTGSPALKVFIDGRAQAAFPIETLKKQTAFNLQFTGPAKRLIQYYQYLAQPNLSTEQRVQFSAEVAALESGVLNYIPEFDKNNVTALLLFWDNVPFAAMAKTKQWEFVYADTKCMLFLNSNAPANREILNRYPSEVIYPSDAIKERSMEFKKIFMNKRRQS